MTTFSSLTQVSQVGAGQLVPRTCHLHLELEMFIEEWNLAESAPSVASEFQLDDPPATPWLVQRRFRWASGQERCQEKTCSWHLPSSARHWQSQLSGVWPFHGRGEASISSSSSLHLAHPKLWHTLLHSSWHLFHPSFPQGQSPDFLIVA